MCDDWFIADHENGQSYKEKHNNLKRLVQDLGSSQGYQYDCNPMRLQHLSFPNLAGGLAFG